MKDRYPAVTGFSFHFARQLRAKGVTVPIGCIVSSVGGTVAKDHRPSGRLFKAMVAPIARYGIAGVIWFQGESDATNTGYAELMAQLVSEWRTEFGWDFPFYWGQVAYWGKAVYDAADATSVDPGAIVREQQRLDLDLISNGGMAVSFDVSKAGDAHFPVKAPVGERFAALALRDVYKLATVAEGPNVDRVALENGKIRVSYRAATLGTGLAVMKKGVDDNPPVATTNALQGFALSEDGTSWTFADAVIDGSDVVVSSATVTSPQYVRYATMAVPVGHANLYNREGFPATPFAAQKASGWVAKPNLVQFLNWDGAAISSQSLDDGACPTAPTPDPTRSGWTFQGWTNRLDGATVLTGAEIAAKPVSGGVTNVYAAAFTEGEYDPVDPTKEVVQPPVLESKVCTGERQTADIEASNYYYATENAGGTEPGTYPVVLTLFDPGTYTWPTTGKASCTVYWSITNAVGPAPDPGERTPTDYGYYLDVGLGAATNRVCVFTNVTQSWSWTVPTGVTKLDYLVVGGGGGGGYQYGGGGGGGGVLAGSDFAVTAGASLTVTVGAGGAGALAGETAGGMGSDSSFTVGEVTRKAGGGGGGGTIQYVGLAGLAGTDGQGGGSGGGGGHKKSGGAGTDGGFSGGSGSTGGGGGGGAGGVGTAADSLNNASGKSGDGGWGVTNDITGVAVAYAGGGGGGGSNNGYKIGGIGRDGGGDGGTWMSESGTTKDVAPTAGADGLGSGGGGGAHGNTPTAGARGGSGVVILRYELPTSEPETPQVVVDGKVVDFNADLFTSGTTNLVTTTNAVYLADKPTVTESESGKVVTYGGTSVTLRKYYDVTFTQVTPIVGTLAWEMTLALNEEAKPTIGSKDATKPFVVGDENVALRITEAQPGLWYAVGSASSLAAKEGEWTVGEYAQTVDFTAAKQDSQCYYKIFVRDYK